MTRRARRSSHLPRPAGRMLEEFRRLSRLAPAEAGEELIVLTHREQEVLGLVATRASDKEIAEALCISLNTVKTHMRNILSKLQVNSRRDAARLARLKRLV